MLCSMTARGRQGGVSLGRIRTGLLSQEDHRAIVSQASELMKAPLYVDDSANLNVLQLRAKARRMRSQYRVELIIIDYLQLLQGFVRRKESRQQEISEISGGLKALSKELGVPVLVLSQLNREVERRDDHKPRLADLRESGAIEQDADVVALLVRPGVYDDGQDREPSEAILVVAKQRNGPTGEVEFRFRGEFARFDSVMRGHLPEPEEVFS
jgi:replicative DNA helicase